MRLAIVGNFGLGYKGTMGARALPLAAELARLGDRTTIFVPSDAPGAPTLTVPSEVTLVEAGRVDGALGVARAMGHVRVGLRLTWLALRARPDVLCAFKPKGYAGFVLLAFWTLRKLGLSRAVLTVDSDDWEGAGGWADREKRSRVVTRFVSWHERWCLRHADVVTVASRELVDLARRDRAEVVYLPNAASETSPGWRPGDRAAGRAKLGIGEAPIVLAYTRFFESGPRRLVDVFARIRARVPDARLVVVGRGLGDEDRQLATLAAEDGLAEAVHQTGWGRAEDLPDYFAAADVAVYPLDDTLLNRAKSPMKLVDLLLAGVPVVADAVGQAKEYVEDGHTGRLVPAGDVDAMAHRVVQLLLDPSQARALGDAARATVPARWSWAEQARLFAAVLASASKR